jgi:hypothetical protein
MFGARSVLLRHCAQALGFGIVGTLVVYGQGNGTFTPIRFYVLNFGANQG